MPSNSSVAPSFFRTALNTVAKIVGTPPVSREIPSVFSQDPKTLLSKIATLIGGGYEEAELVLGFLKRQGSLTKLLSTRLLERIRGEGSEENPPTPPSKQHIPLTPYVSRRMNSHGCFVRGEICQEVPNSSEELIRRNAISLDDAREILSGKVNILSIGRSGFIDEDDARYFDEMLNSLFDEAFHLLRRAGLNLKDHLAMTTSATGGTIDFGVRRKAALHRIPTVAFIHDSLMKYVDPRDPYLPGVVNTGLTDYSELTIATADVVLALPGGAFSLFNDMTHALLQNKPIVLVYDKRVPKMDKSIFDGTERIGNHVALIVEEKDQLTADVQHHLFERYRKKFSQDEIWDPSFEYADEVTQWILAQETTIGKLSKTVSEKGQALTPQEIWKRMTVITTPEEWAQFLLRKMGIQEPLRDLIKGRTANPVTSAAPSLNGSLLNIAFAGRSQLINKTSGIHEFRQISLLLKQLSELLTESFGFSRRDIGVIHGMSNYGADGAVLREMVLKGYPAVGIVKPEWSAWTNETAKVRSDYMLTEDTYEAFSLGYLGEGLGFRTDVLIVFEGNAGVKEHIRKAVEKGIPVIVVPLTSDPLFGNFWDVQKGKMFEDRMLNVAKWAMQGERNKAIPGILAKIEALTGKSVERGNLKASLEAIKKTTDSKQAHYLITEVLDMLDPRTTADANPNIHIMTSAEEISKFLNRHYLKKSEGRKEP
jgi:hypothetical protein